MTATHNLLDIVEPMRLRQLQQKLGFTRIVLRADNHSHK